MNDRLKMRTHLKKRKRWEEKKKPGRLIIERRIRFKNRIMKFKKTAALKKRSLKKNAHVVACRERTMRKLKRRTKAARGTQHVTCGRLTPGLLILPLISRPLVTCLRAVIRYRYIRPLEPLHFSIQSVSYPSGSFILLIQFSAIPQN